MNLQELRSYRSTYDLENDIIELWALEGVKTWRDNQVLISPAVRLTDGDSMAFVGLSVFVHTDKYTDTLVHNYEMLKKVANFILVAITDFGDDLGFEWRGEDEHFES